MNTRIMFFYGLYASSGKLQNFRYSPPTEFLQRAIEFVAMPREIIFLTGEGRVSKQLGDA